MSSTRLRNRPASRLWYSNTRARSASVSSAKYWVQADRTASHSATTGASSGLSGKSGPAAGGSTPNRPSHTRRAATTWANRPTALRYSGPARRSAGTVPRDATTLAWASCSYSNHRRNRDTNSSAISDVLRKLQLVAADHDGSGPQVAEPLVPAGRQDRDRGRQRPEQQGVGLHEAGRGPDA